MIKIINDTIVVAVITMIGSIAVAMITNRSNKKEINNENMKNIIKSLTEQKNDYKEELKNKSQEIENKKNKNIELSFKIKELEKEIKNLRSEIEKLKVEKQKLIEDNYVLKTKEK